MIGGITVTCGMFRCNGGDPSGAWEYYNDDGLVTGGNYNSEQVVMYFISAVTIIVVTIFIATFQNYRIVFLSRYFLCARNDIFARYLRYASTFEFTASLLKFQ